jgi:hypothetical protein
MLEDPLFIHNIGTKGTGNQVASVVGKQGRVLVFHSMVLVGISERAANRGDGGR